MLHEAFGHLNSPVGVSFRYCPVETLSKDFVSQAGKAHRIAIAIQLRILHAGSNAARQSAAPPSVNCPSGDSPGIRYRDDFMKGLRRAVPVQRGFCRGAAIAVALVRLTFESPASELSIHRFRMKSTRSVQS